jgi:hypothetical protein
MRVMNSIQHMPTFTGQDYELDELERLLCGTFDNYEQVYWEAEQDLPAALRHRRCTSVYRRVDLPAFDGRVFYAHKWWDGDPAIRAYRNLYVVRRDTSLNLLRLDLLTIPDPERLDDAMDNDAIIKTLRPEDMVAMPAECNTVWRREGNGFRIAMAGDCRLTSVSPTGEPLAITVDTKVDEDNFLYLSYGRDENGALQYGPKDLTPSRELRARWFRGRITLDGQEHRVRLHDQGGLCVLRGSERTLRIRLRQVRWPTHTHRPLLALVVMQDEQEEVLLDPRSDRAPNVVYASPDAASIGFTAKGIDILFDNPNRHYKEFDFS